MHHAFTGSVEDAGLDFGKVRVSRGSLTPAVEPSVGRQGGRVIFAWSDNSVEGDARADDVALLLFYNKKNGEAVFSLSGATRSDGRAALPLPLGWEDDELAVFISFRSSDGNSLCLHDGVLLPLWKDGRSSAVSGDYGAEGASHTALALWIGASADFQMFLKWKQNGPYIDLSGCRGRAVTA